MWNLPGVKENLAKYIDAGFPILYICTYEESKTNREILKVAGNKKILEWNEVDGLVDFRTKVSKNIGRDHSLRAVLSFLKNDRELDQTLLVIKDAGRLFEWECIFEELNPETVTEQLKEIACRIHKEEEGIDATVIIVSSVICIPHLLEKLIIILEQDLPTEEEIKVIIEKFIKDNEISLPSAKLMDEMIIAFKGLSESGIEDLLNLAVAQDEKLTEKTLRLIFEQKQQMILKAGMLEMISIKESGHVERISDRLNERDWAINMRSDAFRVYCRSVFKRLFAAMSVDDPAFLFLFEEPKPRRSWWRR